MLPTSVDTLYNLGNTCQELGRPEQAIAYFERALRLRPDAIELHNNLGTALQDAGRIDEAIASYRKALACGRMLPRPSTTSRALCARKAGSMRHRRSTSSVLVRCA